MSNMTTSTIRITRIQKTIALLSDNQLREVERLLKKIAPAPNIKNVKKLKGIWKAEGNSGDTLLIYNQKMHRINR